MEIPVIEAQRTDRETQLTFFCTHCQKHHYHGLGEGHRVAHCINRKSPYIQTGYILEEVLISPAP